MKFNRKFMQKKKSNTRYRMGESVAKYESVGKAAEKTNTAQYIFQIPEAECYITFLVSCVSGH